MKKWPKKKNIFKCKKKEKCMCKSKDIWALLKKTDDDD